MYLSRPAEYALRALSHMARNQPGQRVKTRDLAKAANVPPSFLSKIMRKLTEAEILDAQKGHNGGFSFAKPPTEIRFIDVLHAMDFEPTPNHCLFGLGNCDADNPCPLHPEWGALKAQIDHWARSHTLAESTVS